MHNIIMTIHGSVRVCAEGYALCSAFILLGQWLHRCVQRYAGNGRIQKRNVRGHDCKSTCFSCHTHMDDKNVANGNIREQTSHRYTHILCSNGKMCLPLTSLKCQSIPCLPSTFRNLECRKYHNWRAKRAYLVVRMARFFYMFIYIYIYIFFSVHGRCSRISGVCG